MIEVQIDTANDAFRENENLELARIFRLLAELLDGGEEPGYAELSDVNGNTVGAFRVVPEDELPAFTARSQSYAYGFLDGLGWSLHHLTELGELRNALLRGDREQLIEIAAHASDLYDEAGADPVSWSKDAHLDRVADIDARTGRGA